MFYMFIYLFGVQIILVADNCTLAIPTYQTLFLKPIASPQEYASKPTLLIEKTCIQTALFSTAQVC